MSGRRFAPRAVLFDLDGTLLDTVGDLAEASNRMLAELSRPLRSLDEIHSFVGKGLPNLVRRCLTEGGDATEAEIERAITVFRRHYAEVNGQTTRIYPGVTEVLEDLRQRRIKLAVVTNKAGDFTLPLLARMGLSSFFDAVVSGDTLAVKKPDPAVLHHACELLQVEAGDALMIGDSQNDALAARGAGIPVLLVTYGYSEGMPVDSIECDGLLSNAIHVLDHIDRP
ncbi:phosphoglycolate phosphatase [Azoarcus sp. L1K30]|uniref:phosphoglycolate phosphatase n=1 Tax=Azoarcus sp. L1K30 TaxID=2820277 RepID=UPI001B81CBB2|nr:phosphoglycolate phosphatase [Azoarcus sp. L1K30]MBR0568347.1 phosphoglycolate phosphatase [Azoarcus sp. L1K30]